MARKNYLQSSNYNKALHKNLRKLMNEKNCSQQDVADYIGVKRQNIGYYCNGESAPTWETLVELAKFFGVSVDFLLGVTECSSYEADFRSACDYTGLSEKAALLLHESREAAEVVNCLLEMESSIDEYVKDMPESGAIITKLAEYLNCNMPKSYVYINNIGEAVAIGNKIESFNIGDDDSITINGQQIGKGTAGRTVDMSRIAERVALDEVIKSIEQLKRNYAQSRKEAE